MDVRSHIISLAVHNLSFRDSLHRVCMWGMQHKQAFVCFTNVHMVIEAHKDPAFAAEVNRASLVLPDGKPVALACKWLYGKKQERISGMDFMPALLEEAQKLKAAIFLYGSTETVLEKLKAKIMAGYPGVIVAGAISAPFRAMSEEELDHHIRQINVSEAHFVLVALGCPKQEKWMAAHYRRINAVLLGLGGAFPVTAGMQKRAPKWMQRTALEWLFRLIQEPGRLYKRYFYTNCYFAGMLIKQLLKRKKRDKPV